MAQLHRPSAWLLVTTVVCTAVAAAQQPTFRTEIDSVQLDVRVVDQDGRFVRGLTRDDLQVYEDGHRQAISTFALVDLPMSTTPAAPIGPSSDVVSNATPSGRLFVLVLDNYNTQPLRAVTVRQLAKRFVDRNLGEGDRAAIVATDGNRNLSHEFTANRDRLHAAIDRFQGHSLPPTDSHEVKQTFLDAQETLRTLGALATWFGAERGRRKAIVFISEGIKFDITEAGVMDPDSTTLATRCGIW